MKDNLKEDYLTKNARLISLKELEMSSIDVLSVKDKLVDYDQSLSSMYLLAEEVSLNADSESLSKELGASLEKWLEKLVVRTKDDFDKVRQFAKIESLGEFSISIESLWSSFSESDIKTWSTKYNLKSVSNFLEVRNGGSTNVSKLLSRLFIVDQQSDLLEVLTSDLPSGAVIFSHDGYVFSDHLNVKKTYENSSGLLSRRRELEVLEESLVTLKDQLESIEIEVNDTDSILSEERLQLRSTEDYINERNRDAVQAIADVQSAVQSKDHIASNLLNVDTQIDELSVRDNGLVEELANLGEARISLGKSVKISSMSLKILRLNPKILQSVVMK